jgi:aspartyl-tRNA(Asn)/glutamyl-tRNA(Gln) amidotransferase subunit C
VSQISDEVVEKVARLAHLKLSSSELGFYQDQLQKILGYVNQLSEVDDKSPEPVEMDLETPERVDIVLPSLSVDDVLANAPSRAGSSFEVPRIIE